VKNYYVILGISRGANLNQIKKAYRRIAKKYHPDTTQSPDAQQFREIKEAYETLADVAARRKYDAQLKEQGSPIRISSVSERIKQPSSSFNELKRLESLVDDFFEGFVPGWYQKERYRSPQKDLYYEVVLSPAEAMNGGLFPIKVPVFEKCPQCDQTGFWDFFYCPVCHGYGHVRAERLFSLSIPPRIQHGTKVTLSLEDIGLAGVNLFVRVQVDI
jgi:molecular chaperone DnaJ